ncbi:protein Wnt-1-like isoform X1 [Acropora palmata]|uniref:protein Wnt-1-like isoform X1 n=1 Tax=Acropora palmata TaxID=6131 RepID=UPI003DA1AC71
MDMFKIFYTVVLFGLANLNVLIEGNGSWWNLGAKGSSKPPNNFNFQLSPANGVKPVTPKQQRLCRKYPELVPYIGLGANMSISQCQYQFKHRRWNCSAQSPENVFGKIVKIACRETAFAYSVTAAGVSHAIARACSSGKLSACGCDSRYKGVSNAGWQWGGCSDNIHFADQFSRKFVDAGEKGRDFRTLVNLHNNEAGRTAVRNNMLRECKCHGVSEACTVRTCWNRIADFRRIGEVLKEKFDSASMVEFEENNNRNGHAARRIKPAFRPKNKLHKAPTIADLVYYENSPDFCERDQRTGSLGTKGRLCNNTSLGTDGCDLMCCHRGYTTSENEMEELCNCRFFWCCKVKCEQCRSKQVLHRCN